MLDPTSRLAYIIKFILPSTIYVLLPGFERIDGGLPFERRRYRYRYIISLLHIYHPSTFCYSATGNGNGMATPYNNRETNVEHSNWTYVITHVKQMWTHVWYLWTPSAEWMVEVKTLSGKSKLFDRRLQTRSMLVQSMFLSINNTSINVFHIGYRNLNIDSMIIRSYLFDRYSVER